MFTNLIVLLTIIVGFAASFLFGVGIWDASNARLVVAVGLFLGTFLLTSELVQRQIQLSKISRSTERIESKLTATTNSVDFLEFTSSGEMFSFLANELKPRVKIRHAAITATINQSERDSGADPWEDAIRKAISAQKAYIYVANPIDPARLERVKKLAGTATFHAYIYEHEGVDQPIYNFVIIDDSILFLNLPRYELVDTYVWLRTRNQALIRRFSSYFASLQNVSTKFDPTRYGK